jgi:hypothetical protein
MKNAFANNKGQGLGVQYTTTFFLVTAFVVAMTVYVQRTVQGRIRDAREYMVRTVNGVYTDPSLNVRGKPYKEYEPYYVDTTVLRDSQRKETERLLQTYPAPAGIFRLDVDDENITQIETNQASPRAAD